MKNTVKARPGLKIIQDIPFEKIIQFVDASNKQPTKIVGCSLPFTYPLPGPNILSQNFQNKHTIQ